MRSGHTLPELLAVLTLAALLVPAGVGALRHAADRAAVLAVREEVAALLVRARVEARGRGGASLLILPDPLRLRLVAEPDTLRAADPEMDRGVRLAAPPGGEVGPLRIEYDALGLGRVASATIRLRRGRADAVLVVSSLGRVVR
jgi:hypothetical protein